MANQFIEMDITMKNTPAKLFALIFNVFLFLYKVEAQSWKRVAELPAQDIYSLFVLHDTVYAGTTDKVYTSTDNGATWQPSAGITNPTFINAIIVFHGKIYAGTNGGGGVYSSSNLGVTWAVTNNGLGLPYIAKFVIWNDALYAGTYGAGFFKFNEATGGWTAFNDNFYTNIAGNVNDFDVYGSTLIAAAGANGTFFIYDTTTASWNNTYYTGNIAPGMIAYTLQTEGSTIFAGLPGPVSQAILRSEDAGNTWFADSAGLGADFNRRVALSGVNLLTAGANSNYAVVNKFGGSNGSNVSDIFTRAKGSPAGTKWNLFATFNTNSYLYALAETSDKLYVALDSGLYYQPLGVLPVTLINFTAKKQEGGVLLQWQTASEQNSSHFNIERSEDGINFITIGTQKTSGNSNTLLYYNYVDSLNEVIAKLSVIYYRIAEVDINGSVQYSNIETVNQSMQKTVIKVQPNPVTSLLTIQTDVDVPAAVLRLFDMNGKQVYAFVTSLPASAVMQINVAGLPAGMYMLVIEGKNMKQNISVVKR